MVRGPAVARSNAREEQSDAHHQISVAFNQSSSPSPSPSIFPPNYPRSWGYTPRNPKGTACIPIKGGKSASGAQATPLGMGIG
eukprot:8184849-Pyramimonas_sp.AAC.1